MSFEFQIGFPCPHYIVEEQVQLSEDRRGLVTRYPIAAKGTVSILVNDEYFIPQRGLASRAVLRSGQSSPYRVSKYEDELTIANQDSSFTVKIPRGLRVPVSDIVELCNKTFKSNGEQFIFATSVSGFLVFYDVASSAGRSRITVSGSATNTLGFKQRGAKGRVLYPSWILEKQESADGEYFGRFLRFTKPLKNDPIIKVSYTTPANQCVRCGSTYVENDFRYDSTGNLILITNENLLYQACLKALLTIKGSNPYYRWYGTNLMNAIGKKAVIGLQNSIKQEISASLQRYQQGQLAQAKYQTVSSKERLFALLRVEVFPHESDPTAFLAEVVVQNASQDPIALSIVYTAPSAIALAGSNGKSLGIR